MGVIFSLSGCKAVGKTTLINALKEKFPNMHMREGFRRFNTGFDILSEQGYYDNERCYIKREIDEYNLMRNSFNPSMLLRGPEELEFYALHYPKLMRFNWDVEYGIKNELEALRKCRSDHILYLDADIEIIRQRKRNDLTKPRKSMNYWLKKWQPFIEPYIKANPHTTILDTSTMTAHEVFEWSVNWIRGFVAGITIMSIALVIYLIAHLLNYLTTIELHISENQSHIFEGLQ